MNYRKRTETDEQIAVVRHLRILYPKLLLTISPQGNKISVRQGRQFKAMGYVAGTPDIMIFEARGKYHGLHIELKTKTGKWQDVQKLWADRVERRGYCYRLCRGYDEAIRAVEEYMSLGEEKEGA